MPTRNTLTLSEATVVTVICFGLFCVASLQSMFSGFPVTEFSDESNLLLMAMELAMGAGAMLYLRKLGFDIASLVPQPSLRGALRGVGLFFGVWLAGMLVVAPFMDLVPDGPETVNLDKAGLWSVVPMAIVNGTFEEVFLLGVLVRGLRGYGLSVAVGLPLLLRVIYHLYQGPLGALWIGVAGLLFTLSYLRRGDLWPVVFAHILADIVPFMLVKA